MENVKFIKVEIGFSGQILKVCLRLTGNSKSFDSWTDTNDAAIFIKKVDKMNCRRATTEIIDWAKAMNYLRKGSDGFWSDKICCCGSDTKDGPGSPYWSNGACAPLISFRTKAGPALTPKTIDTRTKNSFYWKLTNKRGTKLIFITIRCKRYQLNSESLILRRRPM